MRQLKAWLGGLPMVLLTGGLASAQTTTGTITGRVLDYAGVSVAGVTVSVVSPNLQGVATFITSENGDYLVGLLPPGIYTLTFQLSGLERQQRTVVVAPTQTLPLNVTMGVATLAESVEVVGHSADVLTQTPQVATNFKQEMIARLPTTRDINSVLLMAPGVHPTGPSGNYSLGGAMSFESRYMVNGATVNENLRGQPNNLYIEDAIQETTVATDGISAEYGRFTGGLVNVVTKSGGNLFSGSFRDTLNNDNWRALVTGNAAHPFSGDSKVDQVVPQYEYVLGGPIVKDRIWFFTAGRLQNQSSSLSTAGLLPIPYVAESDRQRYEVKLTGSPNPNHRFEGAYVREALTLANDTPYPTSVLDLASLITRKMPQDLVSFSYDGRLSQSVTVEGHVSARRFTFVNSGSTFTDRINGTLMLDGSTTPAGRFWSPTFCGVCGNETRNNDNEYVKATYFKSTRRFGSHQMVMGYDTFNDKHFVNNHQSGSDYRILVTDTFPLNGELYPQLLNANSTWIRFDPLSSSSMGTAFRAHGLFYNDNWHVNERLTLNLGVRYDKNHGVDSAGNLVAKDSAISPRIGVVWDVTGDGRWSISASASKYVAAINNSIGDISSAAGNAAVLQWSYLGPPINADAGAPASSLVPTAQVIQRVFDWCNPDSRGLCQNGTLQVLGVPGVGIKIPDGLSSPYVRAFAGGISRQFQNRAVIRADYSFRDYRDFYSERIDTSTGTVMDQFGDPADLGIVENTNNLKRRYSGLTVSATYRIGSRTNLGGNYTLSRLWGNFDGENVSSGPLTTDIFQYPEYRQMSWYAPEGDLSADQRHRSTSWLTYGVPGVSGLTLSVLQDFASGLPYGAVGVAGTSGGVNAIPYVAVNPGYVTPQGGTSETYYYTARDAFRTEASQRTDIAVNYDHAVGVGRRNASLFFQAQILNLFNVSDLCGCGATVFNNGGAVALNTINQSVTAMTQFNPFTTTPVEGINWVKAPAFGGPVNRFAFTSPRTLRLSFGLRF